MVPKGEKAQPVLKKDLDGYSADHYEGFFHTDHLLPSVFFQQDRDPKNLELYQDLSLRYIFDAKADPADHKQLVAGVESDWYEVKRNIDRLPEFSDPEVVSVLTPKIQGQLRTWASQRLKDRM